MKQRPRIYYTESNKTLMWDRWEKGKSLNSIARLFDRHHSAIQGILSRTGGIRPLKRTRSQRALTLAEREEISRGVVTGLSLRSIAALLGRAPSTVGREIKRNGGRRRYRANSADQAAWVREHRAQTCKLVQNRALARIVASKLQLQWAPRQITGASLTPFRSASGRPKLRIVRYRATGKATCRSVATTVRSRPWSNVKRAM